MSILIPLIAMVAAPADTCRKTHYTADGLVVVSTVSAPPDGVAVGASAGRAAYAGSSVSVSSRSDGDGTVTSSSASSNADGRGRSVSVRRDGSGCTIVVDDRPHQE